MWKLGSRGPGVVALQQKLGNLGFKVGLADGIFGPMTDAAVRAFQRAQNLAADGIAGPNTMAALQQRTRKPEPTVTKPSTVSADGYVFDDRGWIWKDGQRVEYVQAHDHSGPMQAPPQVFVVHYDAGRQASSVGILTRSDGIYISAQLSLGANAFPIQMLPSNYVAWHAGDGTALHGIVDYHGKTLNYTAFGVECENLGWLNKADRTHAWREETWQGQTARSPKVPLDECIQAVHPIRGGQKMWWPKWPQVQIDALKAIIVAACERYPSIIYLVGHDEVSPRKFDPGPAFNMNGGGLDGLREELGLKGVSG